LAGFWAIGPSAHRGGFEDFAGSDDDAAVKRLRGSCNRFEHAATRSLVPQGMASEYDKNFELQEKKQIHQKISESISSCSACKSFKTSKLQMRIFNVAIGRVSLALPMVLMAGLQPRLSQAMCDLIPAACGFPTAALRGPSLPVR
jgi:hypothetical protein